MSDVKSATVPQPQRLSVSETKEGLVQIEIQLRKRKIIVTEQNFFSRMRLGNMVGGLYAKFNPVPENGNPPPQKTDDEVIREHMIAEVWAPLVSCSSGEIPNENEFLLMPEIDIDFWVDTAKELGVEFQWLDGLQRILAGEPKLEEKEQAQKKSRSRKKSSSV